MILIIVLVLIKLISTLILIIMMIIIRILIWAIIYSDICWTKIVCKCRIEQLLLLNELSEQAKFCPIESDWDVKFRPAHGYVHVGTNEKIDCILTDSSAPVNPEWKLLITDLQNRTDLLSVHQGPIRAQISPPKGSQSYPKYGQALVRCQYVDTMNNQSWASRDLVVHILRKLIVS